MDTRQESVKSYTSYESGQSDIESQKETKSQRIENTISEYYSNSQIARERMTTENIIGIQTRAMTEAQCIEGEANSELTNNPEQIQGIPNLAMNPAVDLHKAKEEAIKEFVRRQGTITVDWYIPNFCNTQIGDLITERLPIETTRGKILFNCLPLGEFFHKSMFKLDLTTGQV